MRVGFKFGTRIREEAVDISDLCEEYPDFYINVKREQQLLIEHDIIVFRHPFYWYSSPAILKQWEDLVLGVWVRLQARRNKAAPPRRY